MYIFIQVLLVIQGLVLARLVMLINQPGDVVYCSGLAELAYDPWFEWLEWWFKLYV